MATRNLTLEENFICHHFGRIYDLICSGLSFQEKSWYKWNIEADKQEVMESIRLFFHLCLNAGKVGNEFQEIEEWVMALAKIACAQRSHGIVSSYKYRVLRNASDPITKFLFGCFDWHIDEINPEKAGFKDNRILDSFDARLRYYQEHVSYRNPESGNTANLLFAMKKQRNQSAHTAISFYANRQKCLKELVNHLLNYIMVFHMIRTECREEEWNKKKCVLVPVRIKEDIKTLVCLLESTTTISITVECVEEESGNEVAERKKDVRLFKVSDSGMDEVLHEAGLPGRFKVTYFNDYVIYIMTEGQMSNPSEKMLIEHDFVDGTVVRVNIPPKGTPQPEKISIRELILYSEKDLPDDVKYLLCEMEHYAQKDEYARMARSLVLASATNNERDYRNYLEAVRQIRESLTKERANGMNDIQGYLKSKMKEMQEKLSKPYQNRDFKTLCNSIDEIYDELGLFTATEDQGHSAIEQIGKNVSDFIEGKGLSIATKATDMVLRQHKDLSKLQYILSMAKDYPEVIEAEFGKTWLDDRIEQLYVDQIDNYKDDIIPLCKSIDQFYDYLKENTDEQTEDGQSTLEYANLLYSFLNTQPEKIILLVQNCLGILSFWLDNCRVSGEQGTALKEDIKNELLKLSEKRNLHVPMTPIKDSSEYEELQTVLDSLKEHVATLRTRIDQCHNNMEIFYQRILARKKGKFCRIILRVFDWQSRPTESRDILSEIRFESLSKMVETCGPDAFLQFVCNSDYMRLYQLFWCRGLGVSYNGLYADWADSYDEFVDGNEEILKECWDSVVEIMKKYGPKKKLREFSELIPEQAEIDNLKALHILEHQKLQIESNYNNQVPDYIHDIMKAHESYLPNHVKTQLLKRILAPSQYPTENLLFVIDGILDYWYFSSKYARIYCLDKFVRDYGKRIITAEAQEEFKSMPIASQKLFMKILMSQKHNMIADTEPPTRFIIAYRMNFPEGLEGKSYIPEADFFLLMTKFHMEEISRYTDIQVFRDSCQVIYLIRKHILERHPYDISVDEAILQLQHFNIVCVDYFVSRVQAVNIEEGKRPHASWMWKLEKILFRQEIKGMSPIEQLAKRYYSLLCNNNESLKFKSGWCEVEKELFDEIMNKLSQESLEVQEKVCGMISAAVYRGKYTDVIAERLMAMKPFCSQKEYDRILQTFFVSYIWGKGKMIISNPSVINGLEIIRDLFAKYGQNVEVPLNGESTAIVDILIRIYKMFQNGAFNDQEIKVTIRTDT